MPRASVKNKIRIGKICYTNCIPFYHGLDLGPESEVELLEDYPARLNEAIRENKIDIAPISSLAYLKNQDQYWLLPEFAIGARDFSGSVILFSKERIEGLNNETIAVSEESLSSSALLKVILASKYKFKNQFEVMASNPEAMLGKHKAALAIGDSALFFQPKEFVYKYDLSELWWNWTNKPFCFAVWAVRKEYAKNFPEDVAAFREILKHNLDRNLADIEKLIKDAIGLNFLDKRFSKIFGYLFNLNFGFDAQMREGLELFYKCAAQAGLAPQPKPLEFCS